MAKKPVPAERETTPKSNSKAQVKNKTKSKKSAAIQTKKEITKENKILNGKRSSEIAIVASSSEEAEAIVASSSEEAEDLVAPSSSTELKSGGVVESYEDGVEKGRSSDEDGLEKGRSSDEDDEEKETLQTMKMKSKGKKRSVKEYADSEEEESCENNLYRFPMNRVSRIIKSDNPDVKVSNEAVFLINRAAEKFLRVFCREVYACAFLDNKKHAAYNHLSSVVSRRERLNFLSDFIPEKVKAEDALAKLSEAEK